jgi:hypothetical protein
VSWTRSSAVPCATGSTRSSGACGGGEVAADNHLAAIHFRVQSAGTSVESAIDSLRNRRVFQGRISVMRAVSDLQHAAAYARESGRYPALLAYLEKLAAFYNAEAAKVLRPATAPALANELYGAQGLLLAGDPYGPSPVTG